MKGSKSKPLDFLAKAQRDKRLSDRVLLAVERGGKVTGEEVMEIAKEFGYSFTQAEFERDVKRSIAEKFAAEASLAAKPKPKPVPKPPLSSCARGCLSYTVNWHPKSLP